MTNQQDALQEILAIAKRNNLTFADVSRAFTDLPQQREKESSGILAKLFGYVGGIFVFAGICIFVNMFWNDIGSAARVIITLGSGYTLFLMAVACLYDARFQRAATPLFLMSTPLQAGGIFVMLDEYSSGGNPHHGVLYMAIIMLMQHGAVLWAKQRTILAFTAITFGGIFFATLFDLWKLDDNLTGTVIGTSLMCIAYAAGQSRHAAIAPFWYFIGSIILTFAVFDAVENTPFELAFLGLSTFLIFLSTFAKSRTLLLVSTLATLGYISYYTAEHFANTVGWPVALIFIGLVLIGLGSLAVRLNRKYIKQA
jgi:hypothetical protein